MNKYSILIISKPSYRLFFVSFLILFLELVVIRFVPSEMRFVGFFSNCILLASFVGIGFGMYFKDKLRIPDFFSPIFLAFFLLLITVTSYDLYYTYNEIVFFNSGFVTFKADPLFLLPIVFILVSIQFLIPSKLMGNLFESFPPLQAYTINICGSIAGIITFTLMSMLGAGAIIWMITIFAVLFLVTEIPRFIPILVGVVILCSIPILVMYLQDHHHPSPEEGIPTIILTKWSPYYKISLLELKKPGADTSYIFDVNNMSHQDADDPDTSPESEFYHYPYSIFPHRVFHNVLIIGSGAGNDIVQALRKGAERIVAVEIDPVIVELGRKYHPENPYGSPIVDVIIDDARTYLEQNDEQFDLIIFALTDSLVLTTGSANLRLESYLFTQESFSSAYRHLTNDGVMVCYNYYRTPWIVDRLAGLLRNTFDRDPHVHLFDSSLGSAAVLIGAQSSVSLPSSSSQIDYSTITLPSDDWPFLYLKEKSIPRLYLQYWGVIIAIVIVLFFVFTRGSSNGIFDLGFFFLGGAFMLLETKNVVGFSLLFGSTWLTNAFVFTGLLALVLVAIWIVHTFPRIRLHWLYVFLLFALLVSFVFPQQLLLGLPIGIRLILAILINFSPVFIANMIFTLLFKDTTYPAGAYGANMLGSFAGGICEYGSLILGYRKLIIIVTIFYALSIIFARRCTNQKTR